MDETCLGTRMVSWEKGRKKWTKLFDPNYIAGNGRNLRMPDDISANGRNFLARDGVKERRMLFRQMDET